MTRDFLESKIKNYNGNSKIIGVLKNGEERVLVVEQAGLQKNELQDFSTGLIFNFENFIEFKNYSSKFIYSNTKNHHIKNDGSYVHGGQNIKRWEA
jgi:hypothetical protein